MTSPADASAEPAKKPGPGLALSILMIIAGTALGVTGVAVAATKAVHDFSSPVYIAPGAIHQTLSTGTYNVYESVVSDSNTAPTVGQGLTDVEVLDPSNKIVTTTDTAGNEYVGRGGTEYYAVRQFKATAAGRYTIGVRGSAGEKFFVSHTFGDIAKRAAGWLVMMGAGIIIGFVGVVMLIVGIVRRRRARHPAFAGGYAPGYAPAGAAPPPPTSALPPAGWYPDPQLPGTNRYWDGMRWTDQTQSN